MKLILNESSVGIIFKNFGLFLISFPWLFMLGQPKHTASFWEWFFYVSEIRHNYFNYKQVINIRFLWLTIEVKRI